jgi:hypothetical protein
MVERAGRSLDLQDLIDHANRILHAGVEWMAQHGPHEIGEIKGDERRGL